MLTFQERVLCGNPLQRFGSGLEPDPEPTREFGPVANTNVNDISMSYPKAAAKAAIEVKMKHSEQYKITHLSPARQFLGIEIQYDGTGVSLGQKAYITTILRRFGMEHTHGVLMPMDPNIKLDLAEDRGEKELEDITDYQAVVGSLMYAALATQPDISYVVAALSCYNSQPFTSHMTAAKRVL